MKIRYASFAVVAGLLIAACGGSAQESNVDTVADNDLSGVSLRIGVSGESVFEAYEAISGEFDDLPYDIELVKFDASSDTLEALRAGAIDVAHFLQVPNIVLAQGNAEEPWTAETAPISIVAAWSNPEHPGFCLVVNDPSIKGVSDLAGKKIAYSKGSLGHVFIESIVEEVGLTDVEFVQLPPPEGRSAYLSGAVDALVTAYRTALALEQDGKGRIIDKSSRIMDYYQVSAVQPSLLDDPAKTAALHDLLERTERATKWAKEHVDEVVSFNVDRGILDQASAEIFAKYEPRFYVPFGGDFEAWTRKMVEVFLRTGAIASDVDVTLLLTDAVAIDGDQSS